MMDEKLRIEFGCIAQQCDGGQYSSINVASQSRSDAILAAWYELEKMQALRARVKALEVELGMTRNQLVVLLNQFGARWPADYWEETKQVMESARAALNPTEKPDADNEETV